MTDDAVARRALAHLDLTSLNDDDDDAAVAALCRRALGPAGRPAAVCVWPRFVPLCRDLLTDSGVRIACVTNFPAGAPDVATAADETREAVALGADEIDVVLPYMAWLAGERQLAVDLVAACREVCGEAVLLKVILETEALNTPDKIRAASEGAIAGGADFIKTSTGKIDVSATPEAAAAMLQVIRSADRPVGLKVAGGIRTVAGAGAYMAQADAMMGAGWLSPSTFRIGASGLLNDIAATLGVDVDAPEASTY